MIDLVLAGDNAIVVGALANRLAQRYEYLRQHSLDNRHYMFKVEY